MNRSGIVIASCVVLSGTAALTATSLGASSTTTTTLYSKMSGKAETPAGDPDGTGTATLTILSNRRVRYDIRPKKAGTTFAAGHFHLGKKGKNGGIVVPLFTDAKTVSGGALKGTSPVQKRSDLNKILAKPGDYYVNLHNQKYPSGAIRGQLTRTKPTN